MTDPADATVAWRALGSLVGFDAEGLALPDPAGLVVPVDTASLRLIAEYAGVHVDHDELVDVAEGWAKAVADRGHDVVGDLRDLVPRRRAHSTDPARAAYDQRVDVLTEVLVEAVTEVGRLRERLRELERATARSGQCGCQASSSAVREVTAFGSLASASCWIETCSKTSRSDRRAAIHTCWSTVAVSLYSTASGRRP